MNKNKIGIKQVEELISADTLSLRNGVFTARRGFFYSGGVTAQAYAAGVIAAVPGAVLLDCGSKWTVFRGGASCANQSHWWVKFTVGPVAAIDFQI
jgi:hypothetical protein